MSNRNDRYVKKDEKMRLEMTSMHRKISRRGFLYKLASTAAAMLATVIIAPEKSLKVAFAHGNPCYPPNGVYCTGCGSNGSCPTGFTYCTQTYNRGCSSCPYPDGWWYSEGGSSGHKCSDCISSIIGPILCTSTYLCGCRSTTHY